MEYKEKYNLHIWLSNSLHFMATKSIYFTFISISILLLRKSEISSYWKIKISQITYNSGNI
jgi:hypothetical protein